MTKEGFLSKLRNKKTIISDEEENLMKELMDLRVKLSSGQLKETHRIKETKRKIAKLKTVSNENKDLDKFNEVMSEDFVWVKHSTGEHIGREVLTEWFMSDESPKSENNRIIYENDEIGVAHSFVTFADGSKQAVLVVYTIKNGRIIRSETGATNMSRE